jgi:hypothetical protein
MEGFWTKASKKQKHARNQEKPDCGHIHYAVVISLYFPDTHPAWCR